jgi:hypothetical protein
MGHIRNLLGSNQSTTNRATRKGKKGENNFLNTDSTTLEQSDLLNNIFTTSTSIARFPYTIAGIDLKGAQHTNIRC